MKALLTNYKQSPRKVRLVADMLRGKRISVARDVLTFLPKKSAPEMKKLLNSAVANAENMGMKAADLVVKTISVDKGLVIRRFKPMARGRAAGIRRTMSIVKIELGMAPGAVAKTEKTAKKTSKKTTKKTAEETPAE